jgi:hypothetical protein
VPPRWEFTMAAYFVFHCPNTEQTVWALSAAAPKVTRQDDTYLLVPCIACCRIHCIDSANGQVLGSGDAHDEEVGRLHSGGGRPGRYS